jgi:hypothetical protein
MAMRRPPSVLMVFQGGPWTGERRESDDPRPSFYVDDEGEYVLTAWRWADGECRVTYTWKGAASTG